MDALNLPGAGFLITLKDCSESGNLQTEMLKNNITMDGGNVNAMDTPITSQLAESRLVTRERRRVVRKPFNIRVDLIKDDGAIQTCTARNIGLGGMFLCTNPDPFHIDDTVRLEIWLTFSGRYKRCRMVARIVQVAADGFGIGFHRHDSPFFRYVYKMLYEVQRTDASMKVCYIAEHKGDDGKSRQPDSKP